MRIVVTLLLLLSMPALAAPTIAGLLDDADRRYADLDYRGAAERAERAARDEGATQPQRLRACERAGLSWLVLGQRVLAKEAFDRLFALDDAYVVEDPSLSGKQRQFIEDERQEAIAKKPHEEPVVEQPVAPVVVPSAAGPPHPTKRPVYKRWYVWTPVALVIVGAGLGVGLGLGLTSHAPHGTLPPGTVGLALHF